MKKLVLSAAVALLALTVSAQEISYGVLGGFNSTSVKISGLGSGFNSTSSETGFAIGGFADIELSDKISLQPEVMYVAVKDFNTVGLNVIGKYNVTEEINVQLGPQLGFNSGDVVDAYDVLTDGDFSKIDLAVAFGAGYDINENIFVQARYALGLNNHFTGSDIGDAKFTVSSFGLSVGYRF